MTRLYFKVKLLSDIILNQKAASEGPNATLDFIPGANFLGIVASKFYDDIETKLKEGTYSKEEYDKQKIEALDMFHSGKVRFGDAHLGIEEDKEHNVKNTRSCKVPAAMFYPKLEKPSEHLYLSHLIPNDPATKEIMRQKQLKQCRSGFYIFEPSGYKEINADLAFAIKSAHDRKKRTSKEAQLYGYQSLGADAVMFFCIETEDQYADLLTRYLTDSTNRIGRSRSAQYGLVEITKIDGYQEAETNPKSGTVTVYADSRLVFIDDATGMITSRPSATDLGLATGKINWNKSQVRTFQYSPWNFKRQCFDSDRCGFEKGSVFVVEGVDVCPQESQYVGCYTNEGFGRVIYNPSFLDGNNTTGEASCLFVEKKAKDDDPVEVEMIYRDDSPLLIYLKQSYFDEQDEQFVYEQVNKWVEENSSKFNKEVFASQWGTIRSIATQFKTANDIKNELFDKKITKQDVDRRGEQKVKTIPTAYLTHGVAKDKWAGERLNLFRTFCKDTLSKLDDKYFRFAIINLAAEMAKRCKKKA